MSETWENILDSPTPNAWIKRALDSLETLLIDHAQCEKKSSLHGSQPHVSISGASTAYAASQ